MKASRLARAEYHWQPAQLLRRAWRELRGIRARDHAVIRLPWGYSIALDPREAIGRSLVAVNAFDLPVTEAIWRLLDEGETCADVGANVGYMTSLMAARLRGGGRVLAFEPVPEIARALERNVAAWAPFTAAEIVVRPEALSDENGTAPIHLPNHIVENRGIASLVSPADSGHRVVRNLAVPTRRLDDRAGSEGRFGLIKVDVEGGELLVFRGATTLLASGRVRDVIFEEHEPYPAPSHAFLESHGYQAFRLDRRWLGPVLRPPSASVESEIDTPNYLATRDPARAVRRMASWGWQSLWTGDRRLKSG